jgi:hypothetical protein
MSDSTIDAATDHVFLDRVLFLSTPRSTVFCFSLYAALIVLRCDFLAIN